MLLIFTGSLFLIVLAAAGFEFYLKMRALRATDLNRSADRAVSVTAFLTADRYRPMLRLLSEDDLAFVPADSKRQRAFRARRRELFRGYLRCLARDYALLLAGVRAAMLQSGVDRPDLAQALAKNRMLFAVAMCKVEFRLALHTAGIGTVDISGLVEALETLRSQVSVLAPLSTSNQPA
jgi:hypothetical protein